MLVSVIEAVEEGCSVLELDFNVHATAATVHLDCVVGFFLKLVALDGVAVVVRVFEADLIWVVLVPPVTNGLVLCWCEVCSLECVVDCGHLTVSEWWWVPSSHSCYGRAGSVNMRCASRFKASSSVPTKKKVELPSKP